MFLLRSVLQYIILVVLTIIDCVDMIIHVRDAETDELVRRLARSRGISITEAIREAVEQALASDLRSRRSLWERTADLRAKMQSYPATGLQADKAFYDDLSGQGD